MLKISSGRSARRTFTTERQNNSQSKMAFYRILLVISMTLVGITQRCNSQDNQSQDWINAGIVPNVISSPPQDLAEVQFRNVAVSIGQQLTLSQVSKQPISISYPFSQNSLYTFIMIDPDAPNAANPYESQYLQWLSINNPGLPGNDLNTNSGQSIAPYFGPGPQENSGKHHYIFLVYEQSYRLNLPSINIRTNFNVNDFANQNGLFSLVAGNFFIYYA